MHVLEVSPLVTCGSDQSQRPFRLSVCHRRRAAQLPWQRKARSTSITAQPTSCICSHTVRLFHCLSSAVVSRIVAAHAHISHKSCSANLTCLLSSTLPLKCLRALSHFMRWLTDSLMNWLTVAPSSSCRAWLPLAPLRSHCWTLPQIHLHMWHVASNLLAYLPHHNLLVVVLLAFFALAVCADLACLPDVLSRRAPSTQLQVNLPFCSSSQHFSKTEALKYICC